MRNTSFNNLDYRDNRQSISSRHNRQSMSNNYLPPPPLINMSSHKREGPSWHPNRYSHNTQHHHPRHSQASSQNHSHVNHQMMSQLGMQQEGDFFAQETLMLLEQEDNNISQYRQIIEKEKQKIANDFDYYIDNMRNLVEDNKAKFWSRLDSHYQEFVNQYLEFKRQVVFYKNIKNDILQ